MTKVENILILELFLCEQNEFFATQQQNLNAQQIPQQIVVGTRRKQKQLDKNNVQYLQCDPSHQKLWAKLIKFTDYFSPKKNTIQMLSLDDRDRTTRGFLTDQFMIYSYQF